MQFGIHDEFDTLSESAQLRLFKTWMCESRFSSYEEAVSESTKIGIGVEVYSFDFGGASAKSQWSQWASNFCSTGYEEIRSNYKFTSKVRTISPILMNVIKQCIESQTAGVFVGWVTPSRDRSQFTFKAKYIPVGEEQARIRTFSITPASVRQNCNRDELRSLSPGSNLVRAPRGVTCTVDPNATVTLSISTTQGESTIVLDKFEPAPTATFVASAERINEGQTAILSWDTTRAERVSISPGVAYLAARGEMPVSPIIDTTYTLEAIGPGGTVKKTVSIKLVPRNIVEQKPQPRYEYRWVREEGGRKFSQTFYIDVPNSLMTPDGMRQRPFRPDFNPTETGTFSLSDFNGKIYDVIYTCSGAQNLACGESFNPDFPPDDNKKAKFDLIDGGKSFQWYRKRQNQNPIRETYTAYYELYRLVCVENCP
jgi:hypothetical protein